MSSAASFSSHQIAPDSLASLPRTCGVYVFWGEGKLPLYIGKSVDIRQRVLAHLRADDEVNMVAQARRVDFIETAGELGALLLEARLIKAHSPIFNIRLRRLRNLCSIRLRAQPQGWVPEIVSGKEVLLGQTDGLYGLFSSVHAAQSKLRELADTHRLCLGLLGLEKIGSRGCFGLQVKTCLGACIGRELPGAHSQRLTDALLDLRVHVWPYPDAVDVVEQKGAWIQRHRIQHWRHLHTWCSRTHKTTRHEAHGFDLDIYKILLKPIMMGPQSINLANPGPYVCTEVFPPGY